MKNLKKYLVVAMILVMSASLLAGCGGDGKDDSSSNEKLVVYTWEGMFAPEVIEAFEEETGIEVEFPVFDTNETMLAKLEENEGSDYDVVIGDDYILETVINEGLATKLDKSKISTYDNINPLYLNHFYDPKSEYTVPFGAGIPLIVYNKEAVGKEITSYKDLWMPELKDNLAVVGNYRVINGITLNSMGKGLNEENVDVIKEAGRKMEELAPNVRIISDNNPQDYLISGEVNAAFMYTSQVIAAVNADPSLSVCYPSEGVGFGVMNAFIPKNAPNSEAAYKFLDFINRGEEAAKLFEFLGYYTTNNASEEFISEELKEVLIVPDTITEGEIMQNISREADDQQQKNWNLFKQKAGQ